MAPARLLCALTLVLACGAAAARAPWHGAPAQAPARSLRAYSALLAVEPAESPAAIAALASARRPLFCGASQRHGQLPSTAPEITHFQAACHGRACTRAGQRRHA